MKIFGYQVQKLEQKRARQMDYTIKTFTEKFPDSEITLIDLA